MRTIVRILTYLADLPHRVSPLVFHTCPWPFKIIQDLTYIPGLRGEARWWVLGKNASAKGLKAKKRSLVYNIPSKHITYLFLSPGASVEIREKSRGTEGAAQSQAEAAASRRSPSRSEQVGV
jgi:hypothetical protein